MAKRMVSLSELDKTLRRPAAARTRRRSVARPVSYARSAVRARAFDTGAPVLCKHGAVYIPVAPVQVFEHAPVDALDLDGGYSVEAFDETDDNGTSLELPTLDEIRSENEQAADNTAASSWTSAEPWAREDQETEQWALGTRERRDADERRMPASFSRQMEAVERDLTELAGRVQSPAPASDETSSSGDASPATPEAESQAPPPAPRAAQGHAVFDEMAHGMRHATEFVLPAVALSRVFATLDRQLDADAARQPGASATVMPAPIAPVAPEPILPAAPVGAPAAPPAPPATAMPTTGELLQDLAGLTPRPPVPVTTGAEAHAAAAIDVRHDVQLVPQQTGFSCWAAGAAMLVGWRDKVSVDPGEIARATGYWAQYAAGLHPEDTHVFKVFGLVPESAQSYTVPGFAELLRRYGPLWVASAEPGPHVRVVTGMVGDGTPTGTLVYVNDPWEQGMTTFRTPNQGARYTESYQRFVEKQETLGRSESTLQGIYVAHCRPGH